MNIDMSQIATIPQLQGLKERKSFSEHYHHIFLLSHMRANTSLMSHILGSHPQISGYYEMHLSYRTKSDLLKQQDLYSSKDVIKSSSQYLFDKLLHNDYELLLEELDLTKIKLLVSIRQPEQSIKSIINLFQNKETEHSYAHPEAAIKYYRDRIMSLAKFCELYKGCYYYYDADLIRSKPKECLAQLQNWLSLESPLTEQYQMFSQTGKAGAGDSSANMTKGKIIQQQTNYEALEIPSDLLSKVQKESAQHRQLMIENALESLTL